MFDDEKIKLIKTMPEGDKIIVIWVQLLCLAGKTNDGGLVYMGQNIYYTNEMLSTLFNESINVVRIAIQTLEQFGMIEVQDDGLIEVSNWEKHQNIEGMEKIKEQNRIRQQKYREKKKQKQIENNSNVTSRDSNETEEELDKNREEKDIDKEQEKVQSSDDDPSLSERFESIWKEYPNKKSRKVAFNAYKKAVKKGVTDEEILEGLNNYKEHLAANEWLKPAHGSTWFNQERWNDDYETNSSKPQETSNLASDRMWEV